MKKIKNQKQSILRLALLLTLFTGIMNAQIAGGSYDIVNNRNCDVAIHYEVSDCILQAVVCNSTYQVISGGGGVFSLAANCVTMGNDVFVWLLEIDYKDVTGGSNNGSVSGGSCLWSGQGMNATGTNAPASCPPSNWSMTWTPIDVQIN